MPYDLGLTAAKRRVSEGLAKPLEGSDVDIGRWSRHGAKDIDKPVGCRRIQFRKD